MVPSKRVHKSRRAVDSIAAMRCQSVANPSSPIGALRGVIVCQSKFAVGLMARSGFCRKARFQQARKLRITLSHLFAVDATDHDITFGVRVDRAGEPSRSRVEQQQLAGRLTFFRIL